ncbi:hypothetical protein HW532_15590 [Kaustia mangrovi]|uniref:Uncharacterized protein n=1 Tax=Kaustia mangrovi TaxID=2593653 RepID=A0A7S8C5Z9_9HYPH|nr:hypothetical protein [Kaustia mangrovi]QPC43987.1 hypothetical protein HW532_15590 [Kaustia mangrovi]
MDDSTLTTAFHAHTEGQTKFTRRMVIAIALMANETPRRIVRRCERLGLCKRGSWEWFVDNGGITKAQIAEVRADLAKGGKDG